MSGKGMPARTRRPIRAARPVLLLGLALLSAAAGCRSPGAARWWPTQPDRVFRRGGDEYRGFDLDDDGRLDYLQRVHAGYIDRLYFPDEPGGVLREVVRRPPADPAQRPLLVLLLDGVAYERMAALRDRGHFRLFRPPARLISTFPTVTDVAYDVLFDSGPTPGYEAGYYDRAHNRLTNGALVYLRGGNERWVRYCDYRINVLLDALMYLYPRGIFSRELQTARKVLDERLRAGRRRVVLYILATDGLGHRLPVPELEAQLLKLDAWLERVVYDWRGQLEILMLADHGMSATSARRFDVVNVLRASGLHVTDRLRGPGDVVVPLFGLLDLARMHTFDQQTRKRVVAALAGRPEVELIAWREGPAVVVRTAAGEARITARLTTSARRYRYEPLSGDPLGLAQRCAQMQATGQMDEEGFADARTWLAATAGEDFPAAVPRLWDGMYALSDEQPDVVVSLADGWFAGSGLFAAFAELYGTHGGLHRRASTTFAMATCLEPPSPISLADLRAYTAGRLGWPPGPKPAEGSGK